MPTTSTITSNLSHIKAQISQFEENANRSAGCVSLLAVSKRKPIEMIRTAAANGQFRFGENYAEEGANKRKALVDLNLEWHYIGHIQSNKTRLISSTYDWVQSVDREKIAHRLSVHRPSHLPALNICLQVNIDGETTKSGCNPSDLKDLAESVAALKGLTLRGLMAIPAPNNDFSSQCNAFRTLHGLYEEIRSNHRTVDTLSMGMTADMKAAISEGATMVRIGTAIFGQRDQ